MNTYTVGDLPIITATFRNASGVATDPTSVTFTARDPLGVETTPSVTRDSTGVYHVDLDLTTATPGLWSYRWTGTGAVVAAYEAALYVLQSQF